MNNVVTSFAPAKEKFVMGLLAAMAGMQNFL